MQDDTRGQAMLNTHDQNPPLSPVGIGLTRVNGKVYRYRWDDLNVSN